MASGEPHTGNVTDPWHGLRSNLLATRRFMFALLSSRRATVGVAVALAAAVLVRRSWRRAHRHLRPVENAGRRGSAIEDGTRVNGTRRDGCVAPEANDEAVERAVEDSFPASDPPASHVIT